MEDVSYHGLGQWARAEIQATVVSKRRAHTPKIFSRFFAPNARVGHHLRYVPAPLAPLLGFALGVLFAAFGRVDVSESNEGRDHKRIAVALYAALVFAPVCAYFVIFAGDWSFAYLVDSRTIPSAVSLVLLLVDAVAPVLGFLAGQKALASRSLKTLAWLACAPIALSVVALLALHARLGIDATYAEVEADFGKRPLPGSPLGYAILWMDGVLLAGALLTLRTLLWAPPPKPGRTQPPQTQPPTPLPPQVAQDDPPKRLLGRGTKPR